MLHCPISPQMLAAQTPGLWQSQLASLAAKMNQEQSGESSGSPLDPRDVDMPTDWGDTDQALGQG